MKLPMFRLYVGNRLAERNAGNFTVDVTTLLPTDMKLGNQFLSVAMPISQPELAGAVLSLKSRRCHA